MKQRKQLLNSLGLSSPHLSQHLLRLLLLLVTAIGGVGSSWAEDVTLFTTNFSTADGWSTESIITSTTTSATRTIKGTTISFNGYKNTDLKVEVGATTSADGTLTFTESNISASAGAASSAKYYMAIPVSDVNGSVTITTTGDATKWYYTYDDGSTGTIVARQQASANGGFTISGLTSTNVTIYIGSSGKKLNSITITTPSTTPSEPDPVVKSTITDTETGCAGEEIVLPTIPATQGTALTFESNARYSIPVINSRLNNFDANTTAMGFGVFSDAGAKTTNEADTKPNLDYVPGLVGKAVLEAVDYYKNNTNVDVKPWFYAIQHYANKYDIKNAGKNGESFDDLNAVKMYSLLNKFAVNSTFPDGSEYTNAQTRTAVENRYKDALSGIRKANTSYAITNSTNANAAGGWWHKSSYDNQMWCDGQYMGPALFATMINDFESYSAVASTGTDWDLITKQFNISWNYLWNDSKKLLYHAFSATPNASTSSAWAKVTCSYDNTCSTNSAFWGRADGWYFLALVDVLEQMDKAGVSHSDANYTSLRTKLNTLAAGIAARQDATSGCWYQVLDETSSSLSGNYLESSATAIFLTAYMKGHRLGYIDADYTTLIKNGYRGFVENFMISDGNGGIHLINCCRSAGLGGSNNRKGDNDYYLNGSDVTKTTNNTEGKVLGAFIMAATEYERAYLEDVVKEDITRLSPKGGTNTTKIAVGQKVNPYLLIAPFTNSNINLTADDFEVTSSDESYVKANIHLDGHNNPTINNSIVNGNCRSLTLDVTGVAVGSATITVHFKGNDEYNPYDWSCVYTVAETRTVASTNDGNGTVKITSKDAEVTSVLDGTQVTYTAIPDDGFIFAGWADNSTEKYLPEHANDNPLTITVTANTSLKAHFIAAKTFNVAYATGCDSEMGSIAIYERNTNTPNLNGVAVPHNMNLDFVANPSNGYKFIGWYSDAECALEVSQNLNYQQKAEHITYATLYAKFEQKESETLFNLVVSSETTDKVTADAPLDITVGTYASTLEGGTATAGTLSGSYEAVNANDYLKFGANAQYVKIDLTKPLAAGDVIEFTSYGGNNKQLTFTTDNKRATNILTSDGKYIVTAGSNPNLVGATTLYVWRAESSTTYVSSLKITRPAVTLDVVIKIDNIIQAKTETSGDGSSESSRETYKYEVPGDYEGATVPVAIATSGTVSESITSLTTPHYDTPTVKDFTITAGETVKYFRITLTRGMSSKSEILGATINGTAAVINENTISQVIPFGGATTVPVSLTLPEGATASPAVPFNMTLDAAAGATASHEVTVTAQDGVSKTVYTVNLTRGKNDVLMVTYDGQEYMLLKENNKSASSDTGNDYFTTGSASTSWTGRTIDKVEYNLYNLSNSKGREISLVVNGAMSFEVFTTNGTSGRTYKVTVTDEDGTIAEKIITHGGSGLESTGLINAQSSKNVTIKLSDASGTVYPFKVIFYTTKKAKKDVTLEYSAAEWDGSNSQPTLTAKDEDGNTLTIGTDITVSYTTDDPNVAEVEDNGNVTIADAANGNAVITATSAENEIYNAASAHFVVKKQQGVTFAFSENSTKPSVREHIFLYEDETSEMGNVPADGKNVLLTGTFGGWNRNEGKYNPADLSDNLSTSYKADDWAAIAGAMNPVDGYEWASNVNRDASDEACNKESYYGKDRAGWFQPADVEDGKVVESYPFTLPVRGGYMTFEPTVNGTLTIYIDQNGAWDNDGGGKDNFLGHFRKHAFFITDQNGVSVSNYTDFSTITKTPVTQGDENGKKFTCNLDANGNAADEDPYNIGNWDEFKNYFTRSERLAVKNAWNTGVNGAQQVIKLDNGSFLVTQRAAVKYTFYVSAGQTYYLFSNFSKMGFCAVNFVEDTETGAQPTATLALEEKVAYAAPTLNATAGEGNHVKNISVPQYKQITLDRKFTKDTWNTIYLPFVMTEKEVEEVFGQGTELILLDNTSYAEDGALEVEFIYHEIQDILAGYPYLIKPAETVNAGDIKVTNKLLDPSAKERVFASGDYQAMGIPSYCTANVSGGGGEGKYSAKLNAGDLYVNSGSVYVASNTPVYSYGYRSYIKKINSNASAPTAIRIIMSGINDENATEINIAELSDEAAEALGINKAVNGVYNLNGQKVADSQKNLPAGLYIVNGRKMVVK